MCHSQIYIIICLEESQTQERKKFPRNSLKFWFCCLKKKMFFSNKKIIEKFIEFSGANYVNFASGKL